MIDWVEDHAGLFWTLTVLSGGMFVASLIAIPFIVVRIPADYFHPDASRTHRFAQSHPVLRVVFHVVKNVLGVVLLLAGIAMLVLPGQGLLAMLLGISFLDFPRKRELELWFVRRWPIQRTINWMRRRRGRPPLLLPPPRPRGRSRQKDALPPPPEGDRLLPPPESDRLLPPPESDRLLPPPESDRLPPPPEGDRLLPPPES